MVSKVKCELCSCEISKSNYSKHLRRHQIHPETFSKTIGRYKLNHEGLVCQFCGKECKTKNSLCNHERLCRENPNRQEPYKNTKSRTAWNKGLTKETDERILKASKTYAYNKALGKHNIPRGDDNAAKRPDVKEKISKTILEKSRKGEWHKSLAKDMHYQYKDVDLDGTWELRYAKFLDSNNISWERCKRRFSYIYKNKNHYYTPDFYLPDLNIYVEIKGYEVELDRIKWSQFPKGETLIILRYDDLRQRGII